VAALQAPACLDWGDVLAAEGTLFVGMSERSNRAAVDQLRVMVAPRWRIEAVALPSDLLHLLSGCAYLGDEALLALDSLDDFARAHGFRRVPVPAHEALAANALALGEDVIVPAGNPETEASIARLGRRVHPVPVSEFEKRDGGVTCLSVLY
jgi:dimethylargininase